MRVTENLRLAASRALEDGKIAVATVIASSPKTYTVRMIPLADIMAAPLKSRIGDDYPTVAVLRESYINAQDGVLPGHRYLLWQYGCLTLDECSDKILKEVKV